MPIRRLLQKIPGGQNVQVFVGTTVLLGLCGAPVFLKKNKTGHDLFSQEKPQVIIEAQDRLKREYAEKQIAQQQQAEQQAPRN